MNRYLLEIGKFAFGFGLLGYVIWRDWHPSADGSSPGISHLLDQPIHVLPLLAACLTCLASDLLTFVRWYVLVRAQGLPFTLPNAIRLGLLGYFLNNFLPGSVGGDLVKAGVAAGEQRQRTVAVAAVIMDRAVGMFAMFSLVAISGLVFLACGSSLLEQQPLLANAFHVALAVVALCGMGWCSLFLLSARKVNRIRGRLRLIPRAGYALAELWQTAWMYRRAWPSVLLAWLLSLVSYTGYALTFYLAVQTFVEPGQIPSLASHFLIVPIGYTIQAFFPAPGGIGGTEWAYGQIYGLFGCLAVHGVVASLTQRVIVYSLSLVGYLVFLWMPKETRMARPLRAPSMQILGKLVSKSKGLTQTSR